MRTYETATLLLAGVLLGCPNEQLSVDGQRLALAAAEAPQDPPEVQGVGTLGPPLAGDQYDPATAVGQADAVGGGEGVLGLEPVADVDGDGVAAADDCDDLDPTVSPLAFELLCDGVDENCNGIDDCDRDGDGFMDVDDPEPDVPDEEPPRDPDPPRWP